jgi:hypothetical protein
MPLAILAAANAAVSAIQQGCELYKEYKGTVLKAKKTYDEVQVIAKEVTGVWAFLKKKFFGKKNDPIPLPSPTPAKVESKKKKKEPQIEYDELKITLEIIAQLKIFFSCLTQLKEKLAKAELDSLDARTTDELLSSSVDIEYAITEIEKLQKTIRETMVYQIGGDLGDLYTKVVKRVGIIQEKQEIARLVALKKRKDEQWRQHQEASKHHKRMGVAIIMLILTLEIWGMLMTIAIASG